ncbi:MAG: hypothetical protein JW938_02115 [Candidatus Omnitrophica bacterium]|nr:hypothetical protein [Candidatus Omnitrophota bacterium]
MEPIFSIQTFNSGLTSPVYNSFPSLNGFTPYRSIFSNQTGLSSSGSSTARPSSAYDIKSLSVFQSALSGLQDSFSGVRNLTYSRTARQDRLTPHNVATERRMFDAADIGASLASSYNMPRIQAGSFTVNNTVIQVDPAVDSLADIVSRINNSTAGVFAHYDPSDDTLEFLSKSSGQKITFTDDNARFLEEANVVLNTYVNSTRTMAYTLPGTSRPASTILNNMSGLARSYNEVMENPNISQKVKSQLTQKTNELVTLQALQGVPAGGYSLGGGSMHFDLSSPTSMPIAYDMHNSYTALRDRALLLSGFFSGSRGFANTMNTNIDALIQEFNEGTGANVDMSV